MARFISNTNPNKMMADRGQNELSSGSSSASVGPPASKTCTLLPAQRAATSADGIRSVTSTSTSDRYAIRTGAERRNLLLSATSITRRALAMTACDTCTSRMSKSSRVPSASIAEVPTTAVLTRN